MKMIRYIFIICMVCFTFSGCLGEQKRESDIPQEDEGYFFPTGTGSCTYSVKTSIDTLSSMEQAELTITEIRSFEEGILYELKCDINEDIVDRFEIPVLYLGLFFVQDDKIYFIRDGAVKDELTDVEAITDMGTLVCCEEGKADALSEEERGWHEYILADGDRREYHGYNTLVETGYYETFIWEEGKGLTGYRRGYGAEADALELRMKIDK